MRCAVRMQQALAELNADLGRRALPPLQMGIGIHTGSVILGDIGAERRREYTVIGDTVNVAARLEALTKQVGAAILISEDTRRRIAGELNARAVEAIHVKGKDRPLRTFRVEPRA